MTASVEIITKKKDNVLSVPLSAVTTRNEGKVAVAQPRDEDDEERKVTNSNKTPEKKEDKIVVFVYEKGVAKMVEVKTGISDYDNIEIASGLTDSTQVITGPFLVVSKRLKDGDKVESAKKDVKKEKPEEAKK